MESKELKELREFNKSMESKLIQIGKDNFVLDILKDILNKSWQMKDINELRNYILSKANNL